MNTDGEVTDFNKFKDIVDRFLGDVDRQDIMRYRLQNPTVLMQEDSFLSENQGHLKTMEVGQVISKKRPLSGPLKTSKGKRIPIMCGWCGQHHPSYQCNDKKNTKWITHRCTNCHGFGHPKSVCSSVNLPNKKNIGKVDNLTQIFFC